MNLANIKLSKWKKPDIKHNIWFHLYKMFRRGKSIGTESRLEVARGWGEGKGRVITMDTGLGGIWHVPELNSTG